MSGGGGDAGVNLAQCRLIYLAPRLGLGGVGDYAEQFSEAIGPEFAEVIQYRHGAPGDDGVAGLRRHRKAVRALIDDAAAKGPVLVHAEVSGGALVPFWSIAGVHDVPVTVTAHDPPELIWWPARTRFMARHKLVNHGLHYPLQGVSTAVQRRVIGDRTVFVLTDSGTRAIRDTFPRTTPVRVPHLLMDRPAIRPVGERPRAIGFFGLVYRGKGFEQIARIRELLPADIGIRVAGRGTESLPKADGIDIVGGIDGPEEDAFFDSVRAIVVPYGRRTFYGDGTAYPSSAVVGHAVTYRTPVVCSDHGALRDLDEESGALVLGGLDDPDAMSARFARSIADLIDDGPRLDGLSRGVERERLSRSPAITAAAFAAVWTELLRRRARPS
jgi:hypothetical protein